MSRSATALVALICSLGLAATGCGGSDDAPPPRAVLPAPEVVLTAEEQEVWAPLPADRSAIPVLVYHGVGPEENFANAADAAFGVGFEDFARQMTMIAHAGYETVDLETFVRFVDGRGRRVAAAPSAPHLRRCAGGLVDGRRRDPRGARFRRGDVRRRGTRRERRSRVLDLGRARPHAGERALDAAAPLGRRAPADSPRAGRRRLRALLRVQEGGRELRGLAGARPRGHRLGRGDARRARSRLRAVRVCAALRQLRPGRDERRAHPGRPARVPHLAVRRRLRAGRERAGEAGKPAAARPHPGHAHGRPAARSTKSS